MKKHYDYQSILKKYSAKNRITAMSMIYKEVKQWQLFARKIQKNYFFRQAKLEEQDYICPICQEYLVKGETLHHITYDWYCSMDKNVQIPECKKCHDIQPIKFRKCQKKTVMVHKHCHQKLHHKRFINNN